MIDKSTLLIEVFLQIKDGDSITREELEERARRIAADNSLSIKYKNKSIHDYEVWEGTIHNDYMIDVTRFLRDAIKTSGNKIVLIDKEIIEGHGLELIIE